MMCFQALERMIKNRGLRTASQTLDQLPERPNRLRSDANQIRGRHKLKGLVSSFRFERCRDRAGNWPTPREMVYRASQRGSTGEMQHSAQKDILDYRMLTAANSRPPAS